MPDKEGFSDLHFPAAGLDLSDAFSTQKPRQLPDGQYYRSTPIAQNVRAYDPVTDRLRGASRPGLAKYLPAAVVEAWIVQELAVIVTVAPEAQA
jgi:hypothetical protein